MRLYSGSRTSANTSRGGGVGCNKDGAALGRFVVLGVAGADKTCDLTTGWMHADPRDVRFLGEGLAVVPAYGLTYCFPNSSFASAFLDTCGRLTAPSVVCGRLLPPFAGCAGFGTAAGASSCLPCLFPRPLTERPWCTSCRLVALFWLGPTQGVGPGVRRASAGKKS